VVAHLDLVADLKADAHFIAAVIEVDLPAMDADPGTAARQRELHRHHAAQDAIREYLHRRFPEHLFVGEEGDELKTRPPAGSPPVWIVDPLDGTTNYVHDCPLYCVSIGLEVAGELVVGVVPFNV